MMGRRIAHKALRPGVETLKTGRVLQFFSSIVLQLYSSHLFQQLLALVDSAHLYSLIYTSVNVSQSEFILRLQKQFILRYTSAELFILRQTRVVYSPLQQRSLFSVIAEQFILRYTRVVYSPLYQSSLFSVIPEQFILRYIRVVYSPLYQSSLFSLIPEQFILRYIRVIQLSRPPHQKKLDLQL